MSFDAARSTHSSSRSFISGVAMATQETVHGAAESHQTADRLGAAPLRREIELLARRGRLQLTEPTNSTPQSTVTPTPAATQPTMPSRVPNSSRRAPAMPRAARIASSRCR